MNQLISHNRSLRDLYESIEHESINEKFNSLIDLDTIDDVMRKVLTIDEMREEGSFFTGQRLSTIAVKGFTRAITFSSVVLDPTCGAGNLLIICSRELGVEDTLTETLRKWGEVLCGYDIHPSFIEAAKLRIVLEALQRGTKKNCSIEDAFLLLPGIKVKDVMTIQDGDLVTVTHAIMNPPFSSWNSPIKNYWKSGKVNAAGVVFDHCIRNLPENCQISAILPDVLRSGSRYGTWREFVSENINGECNVFGRFNSKTKVDVFTLQGEIKPNRSNIVWFHDLGEYKPLSDLFDVCIGPLVAYRDPLNGPLYPYIHSKNSPIWKTVRLFEELRQFEGRVIKPPFIVIRRTSSPNDKTRAPATIISGKKAVAVENHLIVVKPKNSTLRDCNKLLKFLRSQKTNDFINNRIRCRHLTVGVIKDIPIDGFE